MLPLATGAHRTAWRSAHRGSPAHAALRRDVLLAGGVAAMVAACACYRFQADRAGWDLDVSPNLPVA